MKKGVMLVVTVFIVVIFTVLLLQNKPYNQRQQQLHNNLVIRGTILKIKKSNNHSFGILYFHVDSVNNTSYVGKYDSILPYRMVNEYGELYTTIDREDSVGHEIIIESNKQRATIYHHGKKIRECFLYALADDINNRFIKENSEFK